jgi:hypothetical protein
MLTQELGALAEAGGVAVVQAAGTDSWQTFRRAMARWFGRGDAQREQAELERIDHTAIAVQAAEPAEVERARIRQEALWQARIESLLESLERDERERAAAQLQALLDKHAVLRGGVSVEGGGLAAHGDVNVRAHAEHDSIAAGVIYGGARIDRPPKPDPSQG